MTYLPTLIKKINDFCQLIDLRKSASSNFGQSKANSPLTKKADDGLYSFVIGKINQISNEENDFANQDVADQILLIAELYKKALEINGGYDYVKQRARVAEAEIDSALDESDGAGGDRLRDFSTQLLDDMSSDLNERSKTSPNKISEEAARPLLREVQNKFIGQEARQEMAEQKSVYEKGKPGTEVGHNISAPQELKTPENYAAQIEALQEEFSKETDPVGKANIEEQITTLAQLIRQMDLVRKLSEAVSAAPDDEDIKKQFDNANKILDMLRSKRTNLRKKLSSIILRSEQDRLLKQLAKVSNPKERQWIEEKIKLLTLRMSSDLRKRDEIQARKNLINSLGVIDPHGDFQALNIPEDTKVALELAIAKGADIKISKAKYDRDRTEQRGKEQKRDYVPVMPAQRGGGRYSAQIDFNTATFSVLAKKLRDLNNTAISDSRKYIMRPNEKGDPTLKPYVDNISAAIRKKDKVAQYKAVNELREAIAKTLVKSSSLKAYIQCIRLAPHFKKFEESLYNLKDKQDENGVWNLNENDINTVKSILNDLRRIRVFYAKYYQNTKSRKHAEQPYPFYESIVRFFGTIEEYIITNILKIGATQEVPKAVQVQTPAPTEVKYRVPAQPEPPKQTEYRWDEPSEESSEEAGMSAQEELEMLMKEQEKALKRDKKMTISHNRMKLLSRFIKEGLSNV